MISLIYILTLFCFLNCMHLNNPVKMKINLMISSFLILFLMKSLTTNSWLSLIYTMLFLGGILMMFMLLSSFLPNSKMFSSKKNKILLLLLLMLLLIYLFFLTNSSFYSFQTSNLKTFLEDKINLIFMMIWVLSTFFGFIYMLSDSRLSMRALILS